MLCISNYLSSIDYYCAFACVDKLLSPLQSVICFTSEAPCHVHPLFTMIGCPLTGDWLMQMSI